MIFVLPDNFFDDRPHFGGELLENAAVAGEEVVEGFRDREEFGDGEEGRTESEFPNFRTTASKTPRA